MNPDAISSNTRKGPDRRDGTDRRNPIRFEPDNPDRRKSRGRRAEDHDLWQKAIRETDTND